MRLSFLWLEKLYIFNTNSFNATKQDINYHILGTNNSAKGDV
jgi:hypothetical protein